MKLCAPNQSRADSGLKICHMNKSQDTFFSEHMKIGKQNLEDLDPFD